MVKDQWTLRVPAWVGYIPQVRPSEVDSPEGHFPSPFRWESETLSLGRDDLRRRRYGSRTAALRRTTVTRPTRPPGLRPSPRDSGASENRWRRSDKDIPFPKR